MPKYSEKTSQLSFQRKIPITKTDANGDRYAEIDKNTLRSFIKATLVDTYDSTTIQAFEIVIEY